MAAAIREVVDAADFMTFGRLVLDYVAWCEATFHDDAALVSQVFGAQSLARELSEQEIRYRPPRGRAFVAETGGVALGSAAYRLLSSEICEMKRLFVAVPGRGQGLGRRLCDAVVAAARTEGCNLIRLDTMDRMTTAVAMYETMGFRRCAPYRPYPEAILPRIVFMELSL